MSRAFTRIFVFGVAALISTIAQAQSGCTDLQATNYDPTAVINDGSCLYPATTLSVTTLVSLATPLLDENSGLVYKNGWLWTHVDDTDPNVYAVDTLTGNTLRGVTLPGLVNRDWEDIDADSNYVYVGDIGNNSGNRTDLAIYRIPLGALDSPATAALVIDTIRFTYSDQTSFTPAYNATRFDAEAFFVLHDTIHLFSKDWVLKHTRHYRIPAQPGQQVAMLYDSLDAGGLITAAAMDENGVIALLGYDNQVPAPCFLWMLNDYPSTDFFRGNKRKFSIGSAVLLGQTEGITFRSAGYGYISNERFIQSIINVPPRLYRFDLSMYLNTSITGWNEWNRTSWSIYPQPATSYAVVETPYENSWTVTLMDPLGRMCQQRQFTGTSMQLQLDEHVSGFRVLELKDSNGRIFRRPFLVGN